MVLGILISRFRRVWLYRYTRLIANLPEEAKFHRYIKCQTPYPIEIMARGVRKRDEDGELIPAEISLAEKVHIVGLRLFPNVTYTYLAYSNFLVHVRNNHRQAYL